jgi:hypothetical protein
VRFPARAQFVNFYLPNNTIRENVNNNSLREA